MKFPLFPTLFLIILCGHSWAQDGVEQTALVPVSKDAVIYIEDQIDGGARGNGGGQFLTVGSFELGFYRRVLIDFDFDGFIPPGSTVSAARLVITPTAATSTSGLIIYRIGGPWAPGVSAPENEFLGGPAETGDPTWLYRSYNSTDDSMNRPWQQPGGDFVVDQPLIAALGTVDGDTVSYTSEDLVTDIQSKVTRPDQHFGWIFLSDEASFTTGIFQFASGDHDDEDLQPYLEVTFTAPSDFEKVVTNYGILDTLAGRGDDDDRDNFWRTRFEGDEATEAELSRPATAVADQEGVVYFPDTAAHAIRRVTTDGLIETIAGTGVAGDNGDSGAALEMQLRAPNGLAVLPNGNLYILDIGNQRVCKVTPDGDFTTVFRDATAPTLQTGRGLWVASDESSVVFSSRSALKRWTASDDLITVMASGFDELANIALDENGDFLVTDVEDSTVWRVPAEGGSRARIAGGGISNSPERDATDVRLDNVSGVAAAGHGGYFLTTETGGDLWYVDTSGIAHIMLKGAGRFDIVAGDGQVLRDLVENPDTGNVMSQPYSITVAPNGDLLMMTNEAGVLRVIRKGRNPRLFAANFDGNGDFSITWTSQIQRLYVIESSTDLLDWSILTEAAATGNTTTFTNTPVPDVLQTYYRVRLYYP